VGGALLEHSVEICVLGVEVGGVISRAEGRMEVKHLQGQNWIASLA
jgi:hypothetical protein